MTVQVKAIDPHTATREAEEVGPAVSNNLSQKDLGDDAAAIIARAMPYRILFCRRYSPGVSPTFRLKIRDIDSTCL